MALEYIEIVSQAYSVPRGGSTKNFYNIFGYRRLVLGGAPIKSQIEAAWQASVGNAMLAALSVDFTQTAVTVRDKGNALDLPTSFTEAGVGAIAGDREPDYNCVTIQMRTDFRGRQFRGSKHFGPIAESATTGDAIAAGSLAIWQALRNALLGGFTDASAFVWVPVIYSSKPPANYTTNPTTVRAYDVTSCVLNKTLGTMRRRKVRTVT